MASSIIDIELNQPLPSTVLPEGIHRVVGLIRRSGRPIGLVQLHAPQGTVSAMGLRAAIEAQVAQPDRVVAQVPRTDRRVSIVVCTHERPQDLPRCLDSLLPLYEAGHEVLVVDNAPRTTHTAEIVTRYPFVYLCEPRIGLNHARNSGLRAAQHDLVAFIDDDAVADAHWIDALVQPFDNPQVGCVTGLVMPLELETEAQEQFEVYCAHRRTFARRELDAVGTPPASAGIAGMGANMALRRDLVFQLNGFDPRLDAGTVTCSGGDTDMFARILDSGAHIVYTPDALVWHRHRREPDALQRCIFGYGVGLYSFLTKRVIEQRDGQALVIGVRWFAGPLAKAAWRWLQGRAVVPPALLLREATGALLGPVRYAQTRVISDE